MFAYMLKQGVQILGRLNLSHESVLRIDRLHFDFMSYNFIDFPFQTVFPLSFMAIMRLAQLLQIFQKTLNIVQYPFDEH